MSNLYFSSSNFNIILCLLLLIEIIIQSYILIKEIPIRLEYIRKIAFIHELAILLYVIIVFLQVACVQSEAGIIVDDIFIICKYSFIILIVITAFYDIVIENDIRNYYMELVNTMLIFYIVLFLSNKIARNELYYVGVIFLYYRNYLKIYQINRLRNSNITVYSIKEAIDRLDVGLMFSDSKGNINLVNDKMKSLLEDIFSKKYSNFNLLEKDLSDIENLGNRSFVNFEGDHVVRLEDNISWVFKKDSIIVGDKVYIQFAAFNINDLDKATSKLECIQDKLIKNNKKLCKIMSNLEEVKITEELIKVKTIVHDAMGQRVSSLQRVISEGNFKDYHSLMILTSSLMNDIRKDMNEPPRDRLDNMIQAFEEIGVKIYIEGALPANENLESLYIDIIREGIINAVRHGLANNINIEMYYDRDINYLKIKNDGRVPNECIKEGYGISTIRRRIDDFDGYMQINLYPEFEMNISIGGDKYDKNYDS